MSPTLILGEDALPLSDRATTPLDNAQDDDAEGGPGPAAPPDVGQDAGVAAPAAAAPGGPVPAPAKEVSAAAQRGGGLSIVLVKSRDA